MKVGIRIKLDVSKIDKQRLFKGEKGTYLDATAFVDLDQPDQYGNSGMITQDVTKQEKDAGQQGAILGNTKVFWKEGQQQQNGYNQQNQQQGVFQQQNQQQVNNQQQCYQQAQSNYAQQQRSNQQPQGGMPTDFDSDIPFAPIGLMHNNAMIYCI